MKCLLFLALSCVAATAPAATYFHELEKYADFGARLRIYLQGGSGTASPAYLRFEISPFDDSSSATLEIEFSRPAIEPEGTIAFHLSRNDIDLIAENYIRYSANRIILDLPALKADEHIEFLVGWRDGELPFQWAVALLTTEQGEKTATWVRRQSRSRSMAASKPALSR